MSHHILIIDDDQTIVDFLSIYLQREGYTVTSCCQSEEALKHVNEASFQLILLDIMMPVMDGFVLIEKIREISEIPVIFLTAKDQQEDKIKGFISGCDDYITKPFDLTELSLRISTVIKRATSKNKRQTDTHSIFIKDLIIDPESHTISRDGVDIRLTPKEYEILLLLAKNKGRVFSSRDIYELVWKSPFLESDNTVLTHIRNVREKLDDSVKNSKYIQTIWGVGYKVEK